MKVKFSRDPIVHYFPNGDAIGICPFFEGNKLYIGITLGYLSEYLNTHISIGSDAQADFSTDICNIDSRTVANIRSALTDFRKQDYLGKFDIPGVLITSLSATSENKPESIDTSSIAS